MISKPALLGMLVGSLFLSSLPAVTVNSNSISNKAVFGILFPRETRAFYGKESAISSITLQEYITTSFNVVELNIIMNGDALLRIYHSRPIGPRELDEALGRLPAGVDTQAALPSAVREAANRLSTLSERATSDTVIKEYPLATHAKTVEFRISRRGELLDLFEQLKKHWLKEPDASEEGETNGAVETTESTETQIAPLSLGGTLFTISE